FADDPIFGPLFRDYSRSVPRVQNALGSGVILSPDGLVVTNYHVVGKASQIRVALQDRREFAAKVVLADKQIDLAVLKLQGASDLPSLPLKDSDKVEVGDLVLAIGDPFGVGQTVSSGIISGLARSALSLSDGKGYYMQTDAPINPGNSGGALVDMTGHLVGINSAILTRSGGSNGIGFAIPANMVRAFLTQAVQGASHFRRPWAGIRAQGVDATLAESLGETLPAGVLISALAPQSPFEKAGLVHGDVILSVDGQSVNTPQELNYRMTILGIGKTVQLRYLHKGQPQSAELALIAAPDTPPRDRLTISDRVIFRGLTVERINPAVIAELSLPPDAKGVVVVKAEGLAGQTGLQRGDILSAVNGRPINTPQDMRRVAQAQANYWQVDILRGGRQLSLRFSY
ncbi:PDZ domain-containing protein, partial [Thioclava sp. BHET1]